MELLLIDIVNTLREEEKKGLLSQNKYYEDTHPKKFQFFNDTEKYQLLFDNSSDLIAVVDRKGNFIDLNRKFEEESLYSKDEMLGKNVFTSGIITKQSVLKIRPILQKLIQGESVPIIEVDGVTKKGGIIPYELRAVPLFKDGQVVAAQAILRNLTERKENEKTLRESEHNFRSLVEQAAEMLFLHRTNGQIVDVNPAAEKNTGYSREELLNMTVFDIDPDAYDRDDKQQYWKKMQPHDKPITVEVRHKRKDGTIYPTEVTLSKVEINDTQYILALARDITERKKAEEILKDREEKFRLLAENSVDCIWKIDKKLRFTYLSPSLESLTGCKPEKWIGTKLRTHFRKKEFLRIGFIVAKALKDYKHFKPVTFETKILNKENREIDVEITGNVLLDENGKLEGLHGATRDISERKKAEEKIIRSERKYRELFNNALVGIAVHEPDGKIVAVNSTAEHIFGLNEEELQQKDATFWEENLLNSNGEPLDISEFPFSIVTRSKSPSEGKIIGFVKRDNGSHDIRWFLNSARPIFDSEGNVDKIVASFVEITDRKQAEESLRKSEARNRLLFNAVPTGVGIARFDGTFLRSNDVFCDMLGFSKEELSQMNVSDLYARKNQRNEFLQLLKTKGCIREYELQLQRKDGSIGVFLVNSDFIEYDDEKVLLTSARDITYLKRTQQELEKTHKELVELNKTLETKVDERTDQVKQLLRQKDEFINQLGHDLKNPLGPFVQLLPVLKNHVSADKDRQMVEVLMRNTHYMRNLVKKTIDLAKLNSSKTKFTFEDVSLGEIVDEVISVNASMFDDYDVVVENNVSFDYLVHVDPLHIEEVFTNLFNNAVKYAEDDRWIGIDAVEQDDCVLVSVRDKGIGISEEQLPCLFDEYYKADLSRHDFDSSGLGLPICKRIIKRHGGKIWVESEGLGRGSTFCFTLPTSNK